MHVNRINAYIKSTIYFSVNVKLKKNSGYIIIVFIMLVCSFFILKDNPFDIIFNASIDIQDRVINAVGNMICQTFCPLPESGSLNPNMSIKDTTSSVIFGKMFPIVVFMENSYHNETDKSSGNKEINGVENEVQHEGEVKNKYEKENKCDNCYNQNFQSMNKYTEVDLNEMNSNENKKEETEDIEQNQKTEIINVDENAAHEVMNQESTEPIMKDDKENMDAKGVAALNILETGSQKGFSVQELASKSFARQNFYVVPSHTSLPDYMLDTDYFLNDDLGVENKIPHILIYHTHASEAFADSLENEMTIVQVGDKLAQLLESYGCEVTHITEKFDMVEGVLDRGKAYTYSEARIGQILDNNEDIDMVIDLHRDGVREDLHLVTDINEKKTAQVMLFNGISYSNAQGEIDYLKNPYLMDNLALTYQLYALGEKYYPDLFRCIYIEAYRYNLHLCRRSMLIEAGAQTNTFEEVLNAMEPLAELIYREITGEKILWGNTD